MLKSDSSYLNKPNVKYFDQLLALNHCLAVAGAAYLCFTELYLVAIFVCAIVGLAATLYTLKLLFKKVVMWTEGWHRAGQQ